MNGIEFDESRLPLMVVTYRGTASTVEFEAFLDRLGGCLVRGQRYALLFDASSAGAPPALQRRRMAEWTASHRGDLTRLCVGTAFVITSTLIHGALTAILWLQPLPYPHVVVASRREGEAWCRRQLDKVPSLEKSA